MNGQQPYGYGMPPPMMMGMPPPGYPPHQGYGMLPPPRPGFIPPGAALLPPPTMMMPSGVPPSLPPSILAAPIIPLAPADDPANWTDHAGQDGKTYYHNRVTKVSTYDKPACLQPPPKPTPVPPGPPSSLPPCRWKEYKTAEGKTYYSDGKESLWVEPEELIKHKAKQARRDAGLLDEEDEEPVEVVGQVAPAAALAQQKAAVETIEVLDDGSEDEGEGGGEVGVGAGGAGGAAAPKSALAAGVLTATVKQEPPDDDDGRPRTYNTHEEAVAGFKQMLFEKGVSSTAKWADMPKLLSKEPVWGSLKTGEKKQAYAEYQTKRMKEEREEKRARGRKARDNFLKMLAECVEIDSKSRWRAAEELLADDVRFKTTELSSHDKEDVFNDFITELAKKEKEERRLNKKAFAALLRKYAGLPREEVDEEEESEEEESEEEEGGEEGMKLVRGMGWREAQEVLDVRARGDEERRLRDLVEEVDQKHAFEDVLEELEKQHQKQKRAEREERRKVEEERRGRFRLVLVRLAEEGVIEMGSKWKSVKPVIEQEEEYKVMIGQGGATAAELFEKFVEELKGRYGEDKRKMRDYLPRAGAEVTPEWTEEMYVAEIRKALGEDVGEEEGEKEEGGEGKGEGEDVGRKTESRRLREFKQMLAERPKYVSAAFVELHERAVELREEGARRREKRLGRYRDLLLEYYWRSDHVDVSWKEAQRDLDRHSAFNALEAEERKGLFEEHMAMLRSKMERKKKSQKEFLKEKEKEKGGKEKKDEKGGKEKEKEGGTKKKGSSRKKKRQESSSGSSSSGSSSESSSSSSSSSSFDSSSSDSEDSRDGGGKGSSSKLKKSASSTSAGGRSTHSSSSKSKKEEVVVSKQKDSKEKEKKRKRKDYGGGEEVERESRRGGGGSRSRSRSRGGGGKYRSRSTSRSEERAAKRKKKPAPARSSRARSGSRSD